MSSSGRPSTKPQGISHLCCGAKNKASTKIRREQLFSFLTAVTMGDEKLMQHFKNEGLQPDSFLAQLLTDLSQENSDTVTIDSLSNIGAIDDLTRNLSTLSSGPEILESARKIHL